MGGGIALAYVERKTWSVRFILHRVKCVFAGEEEAGGGEGGMGRRFCWTCLRRAVPNHESVILNHFPV